MSKKKTQSTKTTPAANTTATTVTNTPTATFSLPTSASSVQIFNNPEFGDVRVVMQDGEPWFVGKDVADKLLGMSIIEMQSKGMWTKKTNTMG